MIQTYFKRKFRVSTDARRRKFVVSVIREIQSMLNGVPLSFKSERDIMFTPIDGSSWNSRFNLTIRITIWLDYPSRTLVDATYVGRAEAYRGDIFKCATCDENWNLYIPLDIESADHDIISPVCGRCLFTMYDQLRSK